uniref:Uncharacterized protein n=1 Tax=Oryza sativa subsp. japonica TaxID=39947 RepID=Q69SM5_ORYSJ|nr:hypothetical protein [Oryza sativa Japonica Group]
MLSGQAMASPSSPLRPRTAILCIPGRLRPFLVVLLRPPTLPSPPRTTPDVSSHQPRPSTGCRRCGGPPPGVPC